MFRSTLVLAASLLLGMATAQQVLPNVENLGFKIPATQQLGKAITLVGRVRINDFGTADDVLCLFKNKDAETAKFGLNNMKTKVQKHKKGIDYHLVTGQTPNQVFWEFERAGAAAATGKVWTLTAKVVLDPKTTRDEYEWEWECEAIFDTVNGEVEEELFAVSKEVKIVPRK